MYKRQLVYLDTPPDIASDVVGECIEVASSLILVTTQDVCALRQSKTEMCIRDRSKDEFPQWADTYC